MVQILRRIDALVVDCQSTGANPERGHLLELGWGIANPARPEALPAGPLEAHLLALPPGETIPPPIARLTGLHQEQLQNALPPGLAWQALARTAGEMASRCGMERALTVIHFARFERPFLLDLHRKGSPQGGFPLEIVCTHEIARRLMPELPRRGLRALAGYFGFSLELTRRSAGHVRATAAVWGSLVALLEERRGIATTEQLTSWLQHSAPTPAARRVFPMARERRLALPEGPGVYRMLRSNGDLLYVGKATSLKARFNSYFRKQSGVSERLLEMLTQARDFSITATETPLEAALLESDEIKRHAPPYNVALRDGGRAIRFFSPDFSQAAAAPSAELRCGPFPSSEALQPFAALCSLLELDAPAPRAIPAPQAIPAPRATAPAGPGEALGLDPGSAAELEAECLLAGLEQFRLRHREMIGPRQTGPGAGLPRHQLARRLLRLGGRLWRQRLQEMEAAAAEAKAGPAADEDGPLQELGEEEQPAQPEAPLWTPERVVRLLEGIARRAAFQLRRAQWFCALSESTLTWEEPGAPARRLTFRRGRPAAKGSRLAPKNGRGGAARAPVALLARQETLDRVGYDRMRVLTTELKRLVKAGGRVELRLGRRRLWRRETLAGVLRWV